MHLESLGVLALLYIVQLREQPPSKFIDQRHQRLDLELRSRNIFSGSAKCTTQTKIKTTNLATIWFPEQLLKEALPREKHP